jgi:hypothetical protein
MSDVNVNDDPRAGLMDVAENLEFGLVGTLVAWAFITWFSALTTEKWSSLRKLSAHEYMSIRQYLPSLRS